MPRSVRVRWCLALMGSAWIGLAPAAESARAAPAGRDGAWVELAPPARTGQLAVFDPLRRRMVAIGGHPDDPRRGVWVLELAGAPGWVHFPAGGVPPPPLHDAAGTYDSARDRVLVWDSNDASGHRGVYALALATMTWSELAVSGPAPPRRAGESLIYDPVRDRLVLFGGAAGDVSFQDAWALTLGGTPAWAPLAATGGPPDPRSAHVAIYDPVRDRMIVFGGYAELGGSNLFYSLSDAWELSLVGDPAWSALEPIGQTPLATAQAAAVYDPVRGRMVVFGGQSWNGVSGGITRTLSALSLAATPAWQLLAASAPPGQPPLTAGNSVIYDPTEDRMLSFGGIDAADPGAGPVTDVWALALSPTPAWSRLVPTREVPPGRVDRSVVLDPARLRLVLFGGGEPGAGYCCDAVAIPIWTRSLPADQWQTLDAGLTDPARRYDHTAINDPVRDRMILYGGAGGPPDPHGEVRVLSFAHPVGWLTFVPGGPQPPGREGHSAIYDPVRDRMIVFGGLSPGSPVALDDLWALNPADLRWVQLLPAGPPPSARHGHLAIYDPTGDRMIVFGGAAVGAPDSLNAWALDLGARPAWTPLPAVPTSARTLRRALGIYDPYRRRLVVIAGLSDQASGNEIWALNLADDPAWTRLDISGVEPEGIADATAAYDPLNDRVIVPDGHSSQLYALQFPPGGPTPTLVSLVSAEAGPDRARLVWQAAAGATATVYRRTAETAWQQAGRVSADALGRVAFEEAGLTAGMRYGYRLALDGAGAGSAMGETWIDIPAAPVLGLRGAVPNPSLHGLRIEFSLPSGGPARLEVLDIAGRQVAAREVGLLGPGAHAISLDESAGLRPGLYLLRLTQAGRSLTARALVIP